MSGVSDFALADCGDSALRITSLAADAEARWRSVHALAATLDSRVASGTIAGAIPTYDALLIEFDCATTDHDAVRTMIADLARHVDASTLRPGRRFDIPVVYGGAFGPDLDAVAIELAISPDEVIRIHGSAPLTMRCYGSPGGAPMLDGPAFPRPVSRRSVPRPHVPAGAVAVAGRQAVVSARPAPGGWPVIGRTPLTLVDPAADPLSDFRPGDSFQFYAISADRWPEFDGVRHG